MVEPRVRVDNLRELRAKLREVEDPDILNDVRLAFRDAAQQVAIEARMRANPFSFRIADTIRHGAGGIGRSAQAFVRGGRAAYPWYGWADFGSRNPRRGNPRSVGPWTGSGPGPRGGRFIYPAIEHTEPLIVRIIERGLVHAFRERGFDTDADT